MRSVNPYTDNSDPLVSPLAINTVVPRRAASTRSKKNSPPTSSSLNLSESPSGTKRPLIRADVATPQPQPLRPRDINQHVLSLTPTTRSAIKNASNMPPSEKHRQPQLSASAAKSINRPPLTPKVAVKPPQGYTPLGKSFKDDPLVPVAYVSSITPRSGPRQSRGNSTSTTPSGTPNLDRLSDSWDNNPGRPLGMPPLVRTESHGSSRQSLGESSSDSRNDSTKFFYASEVKPKAVSVQQKPASTFFYASEAPPSTKRTANPPANPTSAPALGPTPEGAATKFFYANGTPEPSTSSTSSRPPLAAIPSSGSGSSASTTSRMAPVRPSTSNSTPGYGTPAFSRPESPVKGQSANTPQPHRNSIVLPNSPSRTQLYSPPVVATATNPVKRRVSIDAPPKVAKSHARTGSVPTMDAFNATKFIMPTVVPSELTSPPLTPGSAPPITMASLLQMADDLEEEEEEESEEDDDEDSNEDEDDDDDDDDDEDDDEENSDDDDSQKDSYSPSKSSQSKEPISDYVLSARRERKVQDLEIRNTSLEAINKTLERQLRKQTAELRRFRRLSRAGKLPLDSTATGRVASVAVSEAPTDLSDLSEEESVAPTVDGETDEEDEDEEEEDSFMSEDSSSTASASGSQSDDSKLHKRDERRLQLDLSKHKELLLDSQKMNQSLKRCLNWTEELIKEGQKALAYQVRVSDVQFGYGGRVLAPSDEEDDDTSHHADETLTNIDSDVESVAVEPWVKGPQDRDSGIELPVDSS
ncbi:hypothetical protein PT974_05927 [Cladobotryum mycophilum]|uniref:BZIP domain-containing protein n=1 Tax=Cladobotryum mycophilum TaxID=491253 RepID=A0ABR0SK41_9HYPO